MNSTNQTKLTEVQERELALRIAQGDQRALDKLVTANIGFVVSLARQYANQGLPIDDLVSEGNIAMMLAAMKWDAGKGGRFVQYAVWDIRKAMERAIEQQVGVVRKPVSDQSKLSQFSMDAPLRAGHTRTFGETMPSRNQRNQQEQADDSSFVSSLEESIFLLNEREQQVIRMYYGLGCEQMNMMEIALQMQLKRERVRQIRKKAERKLRRPLRHMVSR